MASIDDDTEALFKKRVYDIAGTVRGVNVYLNNKRIPVRNFKSYVEMYTSAANEAAKGQADLVGASPSNNKTSVIYETVSDRWEIAFAVSEGQFQQVSFVNSIATTKGGTHVDYVAKQLIDHITEIVKKKNKGAAVKPFQIKNHLWIFVNCLVENPAFDSQTKEYMTLLVSKFGSKCKVSDEFMKKGTASSSSPCVRFLQLMDRFFVTVTKSGVVDNVLSWAQQKQNQDLKKTDGRKQTR
jgi:DNA topoisomerase-2